MHHFIEATNIKPTTAFPDNSIGFRRFSLVDRTHGSVHSGWGLCELDAGGRIDSALQSFEESFFMLEGHPVLILDGRGYKLEPGACGVIPVGMRHAWLGPDKGTAKWTDMCAPCPNGENFADDTYFIGPPDQVEIRALDIRDPSSRHLFRMADDDIDPDKLKIGARVDAPKVSASMATALLVYSGISLKMLVDERLDAALHSSFMVEYQPGGCTHAFYNRSDTEKVRWLETQSPQPPQRNSYRFRRDWDYVADNLEVRKTGAEI